MAKKIKNVNALLSSKSYVAIKKMSCFLFIVCCLNLPLFAMQSSIEINTNNISDYKISKNLNGGFIELLMDYVNGFGGLWAQEIMDRGFEPVSGRINWYWFNYFSDGDTITHKNNIQIVKGGYNKLDSHQLMIQNSKDVESGLFQRVYLNDSVSHIFYIYARSENADGVAKLVLFDTLNNERVFEKELEISNEDWYKNEFEIPALPNWYQLNLAITYKGDGEVYFDEVSLVPTNNVLGMRKEWADIFREFKQGILRYPGGFFVEIGLQYWKDGIGSIDQRRSYNEFGDENRSYVQRYDFGTDEYIRICREFDIEPYISINIFRNSTFVEEAVEYLEYLNGDTTTAGGKLRAMNGHPEPYNVKYIEIGNEPYFFITAKEYANRYELVYDAIKEKFPDIVTFLIGDFYEEYFGFWLDSLVIYSNGRIINKIDYYSTHPVAGSRDFDCIYKTHLQISEITIRQLERQFFPEMRKIIDNNNYNFKLAFCEWWSFFNIDRGESIWKGTILNVDDEQNVSMMAAIVNALFMNIFYRNTDILHFATRTLGLRFIRTELDSKGRKQIFMSPPNKALTMMGNHRGDYNVFTNVVCDSFYLDEYPHYWTYVTPYLDVTTTISDDSIFISVVNIHPFESITTEISILGSQAGNIAKTYSLTSDSFCSIDTPDEQDIIKYEEDSFEIQYKILDSNTSVFDYTFPKHSITILALPYKKLNIINENDIVIFPNPNHNLINISLYNDVRIKNISIIDNLGSRVYENSVNNFENRIIIRSTNLAKGAYQVVLECLDGKIITKNIVID